MIAFPNAKINIGLNIIRKREDGFHDIETIMYPLTKIIYDALEITPAKKFELKCAGIKIPGELEHNLCIKAYNLINKDYPLPKIKINLLKAIPIGAGLGGGSADAAFFIRLLNDAFNLGISWGEMHHYARQLGSDCSFFISNKPTYAQAKGDQFESIKLDLSSYYISVIYPNIHVNTALAYSGVIPKKPKSSLEYDIQNLPIEKWKNIIHNDFEDSIFKLIPDLEKIKKKLYQKGAVYASMSGSGSTVYGIFRKKPKMKKEFSKLSVWEGRL